MNWNKLLTDCNVKQETADKWAPVFESLCDLSEQEIPLFLGQILTESGNLEHLEESTYYSHPERIHAIWPSRFPTVESAIPYAKNPEGLANKVYSGRMGNTEPGDGYKYRGRGLMMVTGKSNYQTVGETIGLDLVNNPSLLSTPEVALTSALSFWSSKVPKTAIETKSVEIITRIINGGLIGLAERKESTELAFNSQGLA